MHDQLRDSRRQVNVGRTRTADDQSVKATVDESVTPVTMERVLGPGENIRRIRPIFTIDKTVIKTMK